MDLLLLDQALSPSKSPTKRIRPHTASKRVTDPNPPHKLVRRPRTASARTQKRKKRNVLPSPIKPIDRPLSVIDRPRSSAMLEHRSMSATSLFSRPQSHAASKRRSAWDMSSYKNLIKKTKLKHGIFGPNNFRSHALEIEVKLNERLRVLDNLDPDDESVQEDYFKVYKETFEEILEQDFPYANVLRKIKQAYESNPTRVPRDKQQEIITDFDKVQKEVITLKALVEQYYNDIQEMQKENEKLHDIIEEKTREIHRLNIYIEEMHEQRSKQNEIANRVREIEDAVNRSENRLRKMELLETDPHKLDTFRKRQKIYELESELTRQKLKCQEMERELNLYKIEFAEIDVDTLGIDNKQIQQEIATILKPGEHDSIRERLLWKSKHPERFQSHKDNTRQKMNHGQAFDYRKNLTASDRWGSDEKKLAQNLIFGSNEDDPTDTLSDDD